MHQQVQHSESSTLHTLTPPDELIKGLVKAVKVALNEKYEIFPRKIGALVLTRTSARTQTCADECLLGVGMSHHLPSLLHNCLP